MFPRGVQLKRKFVLAAAIALAATNISTSAAAEKPVELSTTELAAVQSETYNVPASTAFSASIAALQTLGYVDINASKDAGTISGQTEAKGKIFYNILWGFGKKKLTQKASLLIEDNGPGQSLVRLNLHVTESKQRGIFGTAFSDGKLLMVAEPYTTFFSALNAEVARRASVPAAQAETNTHEPTAAAPTPEGPATPATTSNPK